MELTLWQPSTEEPSSRPGDSGLMMQGASLGKILSLGFGEGFLGSTAAQGLRNEDGEINWALAIGDGMFQAVMAGLVWRYSRNGEKRIVWMRNIFNLIIGMNLPLNILMMRSGRLMKNFWISRQVLDEKYIYHIIPQNI